MRYLLTPQQSQDEIEMARRRAEKVKRPQGVFGIRIEPDQDQDGNPMFIVSIDVEDDPNPSDARLDELVDYEDKVAKTISDGRFASWPLINFVPRETTK